MNKSRSYVNVYLDSFFLSGEALGFDEKKSFSVLETYIRNLLTNALSPDDIYIEITSFDEYENEYIVDITHSFADKKEYVNELLTTIIAFIRTGLWLIKKD